MSESQRFDERSYASSYQPALLLPQKNFYLKTLHKQATSKRNSGVTSPKIWGRPKNLGRGQNVWFQANNTILFGKTPLKAQNDYIF